MNRSPISPRLSANPTTDARSERQAARVLDDFAQSLTEVRRDVAVHVAVIGDDVDGHDALHANHAADRDDGLLGRTDGQDGGLVRREDGVELVDAEHAEVGDGEVAVGVIRGAKPNRGAFFTRPLQSRPSWYTSVLPQSLSTGVIKPSSSATATAMLAESLYTTP